MAGSSPSPGQEEMVHLNNVDRPGSDVDAYVNGLDRILRLKVSGVGFAFRMCSGRRALGRAMWSNDSND